MYSLVVRPSRSRSSLTRSCLSLIHSEMCIRDSPRPVRPAADIFFGRRQQDGFFIRFAEKRRDLSFPVDLGVLLHDRH